MTKILSCGYVRTPEDRDQEQADRQLLQSNLLLLLGHAPEILDNPDLYFCAPACCWASFSYVTADGPLPLYLGYLLDGYRSQILIEVCPNCNTSTLMASCFGGSPLSGANSFSGYCLVCARQSNICSAPGALMARLKFLCRLRKTKPLYESKWIEHEGHIFDWSGNGLRPALKRELITRQLYTPLSLSEVITTLT
jgi:hypothetical protein